MNYAPISLILIAGLGLIAVLTLGVFFAVKPRTKTHFLLFEDETNETSSATTLLTTKLLPTTTTMTQAETTTTMLRRTTREWTSPPEPLPTLFTRPPTTTTIQYTAPPTTPMKEWVAEKRLEHGKVVGITVHNGFLYAASHDEELISVLTTPQLRLVEEIPCSGCQIYDVAVLNNGDLVVAQGDRQKLSKIDRESKTIVKELHLSYSTKGIAVSERSDHIYVLARSHDKVYRYNRELEEQGIVYLPNDSKDDCNFLAVSRDERVFVSCENNVYIVQGLDGEYLGALSPREGGTYSVGIAVTDDQVFVVERGKTVVDRFSLAGRRLLSLGNLDDALWSDIAVAGPYFYVVDYITTTIKAKQFE